MPPTVASLVASDLIRSARDEARDFDDRHHPDPVLVRHLSRYQRRLVSRVVQLNPAAMTTFQTTSLPLADFDAGVTVPDFKRPAQIELEASPGSGTRVPKYESNLVPWEERFRFHLAAYVRGSTLYLTGQAQDWVGFNTLRFYYVAEVDVLTDGDSVLVLPNAAEPVLVAYLAYVMAKRGSGEEAGRPDPKTFRADWRETEEEFLDEMARQSQSELGVIHDVA